MRASQLCSEAFAATGNSPDSTPQDHAPLLTTPLSLPRPWPGTTPSWVLPTDALFLWDNLAGYLFQGRGVLSTFYRLR